MVCRRTCPRCLRSQYFFFFYNFMSLNHFSFKPGYVNVSLQTPSTRPPGVPISSPPDRRADRSDSSQLSQSTSHSDHSTSTRGCPPDTIDISSLESSTTGPPCSTTGEQGARAGAAAAGKGSSKAAGARADGAGHGDGLAHFRPQGRTGVSPLWFLALWRAREDGSVY